MRPRATETVRSVSASAGRTTSSTSEESARGSGWIVLGGRRCAQNVVSRNAGSLAGELIAAMRAPDAFEDAVPYQSLQDRLEVARR